MPRSSRSDLKSDLFAYEIDERALAQARMMDGKLILVTNLPDLTPAEAVSCYKALAALCRSLWNLTLHPVTGNAVVEWNSRT